MEAYRMDEYRHIEQDGARASAIFAGFIKSAYNDFRIGPGTIPAGGQVSPNTPAPTGAKDAPTEMVSGLMQTLPTGTDVTFASHNRPGNNYEPFVKDSKRAQSVGTGMSYEGFANDYTDSSYASARSGSLEERLGYRGQQIFLDEKMNWGVIAWFMEAAAMVGLAPPMPEYFADPLQYHEMVTSRTPGWQWVDERNATQAAEKKLDLVIETHSGLAAERGLVFEDVVETRIEEESQLQELYTEMAKTQELKEAVAP
jgi:capsid protein